ncbi:MAG: hypothetical protein IKU83_02520 [Lachnospiraceae bacterium]|nr:hypothetical protein [Lachnospiraceae bacterium]
MDVLGQFKENLNLLLQIAATEENRLTREQVQGCFGDLELAEEQWELIYHYLEMNQVKVEDHEMNASYVGKLAAVEEAEGPEGTPEDRESAFFAMYLEELAAIPPLSIGEEEVLLQKMWAGDAAAEERLIEGKLALTARVAKEFAGRGVGEADLVQEGNIAMMMALRAYEEGPLDAFLEREIRTSLEMTVVDEGGEDQISAFLASQANALLKASTEMAERLGREATVEELAKYLGISEEMVEDLMKMSLDALSVVENGNLS